jgi:hypothetical protein
MLGTLDPASITKKLVYASLVRYFGALLAGGGQPIRLEAKNENKES